MLPLSICSSVKSLKYKGNASYVYGQDETNNEPLIMMVPFNISNSLEFSKESWSNFYLNVSHRFFAHQNRFPIHNVDVQLFDDEGNPYYKTLDISTPPKSYNLWSIQTGIDIAKGFGAQVSVQNILNKTYRDYLNRLRFFSDEMGRNIVLTLNYKF